MYRNQCKDKRSISGKLRFCKTKSIPPPFFSSASSTCASAARRLYRPVSQSCSASTRRRVFSSFSMSSSWSTSIPPFHTRPAAAGHFSGNVPGFSACPGRSEAHLPLLFFYYRFINFDRQEYFIKQSIFYVILSFKRLFLCYPMILLCLKPPHFQRHLYWRAQKDYNKEKRPVCCDTRAGRELK